MAGRLVDTTKTSCCCGGCGGMWGRGRTERVRGNFADDAPLGAGGDAGEHDIDQAGGRFACPAHVRKKLRAVLRCLCKAVSCLPHLSRQEVAKSSLMWKMTMCLMVGRCASGLVPGHGVQEGEEEVFFLLGLRIGRQHLDL